VSTAAWNEIYAVYVQDKYNLGLGKWMDKENPHALQEIAATMLEAARKGRWDAPAAAVAALSRLYAESVVAHGDSGGLVSGGNKRLEDFVSAKLHASGKAPAAALAARMSAALRDARAPAAAQASAAAPSASQVAAALATALVTGERLEKVNHAPPPPAVPRTPLPTVLALFAALAFIAIGFILRWGVPC
jgi:cobaltochelatase CobN